MGYVNQVIRSVREDAGLKLEAVAQRTHFSKSSISRYEIEGCAVPVEYVHRLSQVTHDFRLVQLVDASAEVLHSQPIAVRIPPVTPLGELLPRVLGELKRFGLLAETVERIVRDGRVDESDDTAIASLLDVTNKLVVRMVETNRSIVAHRDAVMNKANS